MANFAFCSSNLASTAKNLESMLENFDSMLENLESMPENFDSMLENFESIAVNPAFISRRKDVTSPLTSWILRSKYRLVTGSSLSRSGSFIFTVVGFFLDFLAISYFYPNS